MNIIEKFIPATNKNYTGKPLVPQFVTIHNTGNYAPSAGAKNHANYLYNGSDGIASWHYSVDDTDIYQSLPDNVQGCHAGSAANTQSIGIEICLNNKDGFPAACRSAALLTAGLLTRYGLGADAVKQHFDWTGKDCPYEIRRGQWGVTWEQFLDWVREAMAPAPPAVMYRVQVGAFTNKDYAENYLQKVKAAGFDDAFIRTE